MKNFILKCAFSLLLSFSLLANASDLAKEQRWASQVVDDLFDGEAIILNDGKHDFLTLWTKSEIDNNNKRVDAIIIMHGLGVHPDWPQVINPLRVSLAEQGTPTLSVQLPILDNEAAPSDYLALMDDVAPRLNAALAQLSSAGHKNVAIVAHSMGSRMAAYYLANTPHNIRAFVAIGMNDGNEAALAKINIPVLDLFGENDLEGVLSSAKSRAKASENNPDYLQRIAAEADHFFNGHDDALINTVSKWLTQLK